MAPTLIALAGPSRSGKGTCAAVIKEVAATMGLTVCERQLSGPGKQYVASAFRPEITEDEAIAWFEELKSRLNTRLNMLYDEEQSSDELRVIGLRAAGPVSLQQYLQRMLQGARDRWGEDFWTDKLLPIDEDSGGPAWRDSFLVDLGDDVDVQICLADVAVISDLRQVNEAKRVQKLGGVVLELIRPDVDDSYVTGRGHITEQRLPKEVVDHVLPNDGTLDEFKELARLYITGILEGR